MPAGIRAVTGLLIGLDGDPASRDLTDLALAAVRRAPRGSPGALAELAEVAAWIAFEEERQPEAHALNRLALDLARAAGDRDLEVLVLLNGSMQRAHVGRLAEALRCAELGASLTRSPRVRGVFALRRARAYSRMGLPRAALEALAESEVALADDPSAPPWAWWVDEEELAAHRGAVLANLGRLAEAAEVFPVSRGPRFREVVGAMRYRTLLALGEWSGAPPVFTSPRARRTAQRSSRG
ncbi:hypothetical protein ACFV4N_17925 [Actinosynnema sp. NPDC059797]